MNLPIPECSYHFLLVLFWGGFIVRVVGGGGRNREGERIIEHHPITIGNMSYSVFLELISNDAFTV